jgi:hypothetical protein
VKFYLIDQCLNNLGHTTASKNLRISKIEVYGLGGVEALEAQQEHRRILQKLRDKKKTVDKKAFLESDFDKEFLLGNTFGHKKEVEDRDGGS